MEIRETQIQRGSGDFISFDGLNLYEQWWRPQTEPRAVVVFLHALCEHSGCCREAAEYITIQGYAVDAFDLRGHGKSEGETVYVESFDNYLKDLEIFLARVENRHPNLPVFLLGQSMGAGIGLLYCITRQPQIRGVIISAPPVKITEDISAILQKMSFLLSKVFPKLPTIKLKTKALSRDPEVLKKRNNDPLVYQGKILARTGAELVKASKQIQAQLEKINLPLLILHGTEDRLSAVEGSKILYDGVKERDKTIKLYKGLFHDIMNEPEKEQVLHDIVTWMNSHSRS